MSCTPEAEMESHAHSNVLPLHRGYVTRPDEEGMLHVAPVSERDGEPLTFGESLRFWGVVWVCCVLGGLALGELVALFGSH